MRFAGDFFGVPLTTAAEEKGSVLADYFPELKKIQKSSDREEGGARGFGNTRAVTPFAGFKTLEGAPKASPAPQFFGFKTFDQSAGN